MKLTSILAVLASSGFLDMVAADDQSAVKSASTPVLKKRDAFTCYGYTNTSVSDCHKVVDNIRNDKQQDITLWPDVCAVWVQGACKVRFCAQPYVTRPVTRSGTWLATYITSPVVDSCISQGNMGVFGDNSNLNGHEGTYRVWVS